MELTDPEIEKPMSKQAFSKARHKISPEAFKELFEMTGQTIIESDAFGRYKGYRVFAVDGTELQLPKEKEILEAFPQRNGCFTSHARASTLCDVITGFVVHASLGTIKNGERDLAMEHLEYFKTYKQTKDIIIAIRHNIYYTVSNRHKGVFAECRGRYQTICVNVLLKPN